jgi:molybdate transport system substrate-binding protein
VYLGGRSLKMLLGLWLLPLAEAAAQTGSVNVAVAANFAAPMQVIAQAFESQTGYRAVLSYGATGQFYAQIKHGAPFDVLLAADEQTPLKLEQEGLAVVGSRFTYAQGRLVLWSRSADLIRQGDDILKQGDFRRLAIANPKLAPYGQAAEHVLRFLGVWEALAAKLVQGANISQAYQFIESGNAPLGFVALSQVYENGAIKQGSGWIVPSSMHSPIKQDAVWLVRGRANPAAEAFLAYLRSDAVLVAIESFGYER